MSLGFYYSLPLGIIIPALIIAGGARADGDGPRPAAPLSLPPLNHLASQHVSEDEGACKLPPQRRVTSQVMSHWAQRKAIVDKALGCRLSMPSHAQRHANPATPSFKRTCPTVRRLTASQRRGGSIDTPVPRTYLASCCFAHGRRRSARLRGRLGSASTLVCRFLSCIRLPRLSSSALAISTSLTCTVITSTPTDAQETILTALEEIYNDSGPPVAATFQRWRRATASPVAATSSSRTPTSVASGISLLTLSVRTNSAAVTSRT